MISQTTYILSNTQVSIPSVYVFLQLRYFQERDVITYIHKTISEICNEIIIIIIIQPLASNAFPIIAPTASCLERSASSC